MFMPFRALVKRDALRTARSFWPFAFVLLFGGAVAETIGWIWPQRALMLPFDMGKFTRELLLLGVYSGFAGIFLLVAPRAALSVVQERQQATFEQTTLTLVRPAVYVLAKLVNSAFLFSLILMATIPVWATVSFMAGVELFVLLAVAIHIAACVISCASIGILCSARSKTPVSALVSTLLILILLWGLAPYGILVGLGSQGLVPGDSIISQFAYWLLAPLPPLDIIQGAGTRADGLFPPALQLLIAIACLLPATRSVAQAEETPTLAGRITLYFRNFFGSRFKGAAVRLSFRDRLNPVFIREQFPGGLAGARAKRFVYIFAAILGVPAAATIAVPAILFGVTGGTLSSWGFAQTAMVFLITPVMTAGCFTRDHELANSDMLRLTLLRPGEILAGKTRAAALAVQPLLLILLVVLTLATLAVSPDRNGFLYIFGSAIGALACTWISLTACVLASTLVRKTVLAICVAFVLSACVYIVFAALIGGFYPDLVVVLRVFLGIHLPDALSGRASDSFMVMTSPLIGLEAFYHTIGAEEPRHGVLYANLGVCSLYCLVMYWLAKWRLGKSWGATVHKRRWYHQ